MIGQCRKSTSVNQDAVKHGKIPQLFQNQNKGMRDPGWYWLDYRGWGWNTANWDGSWNHFDWSEDAQIDEIGPKVEEPEGV